MTHFLNNRSCNDDYCPTEKLMIIPPAMLKINKHLNNIDTQLEALYNISEPNINEEHEEPRQPFDEHEQEIIKYAKRYDLSIAEAVDYLKTCHHCGNPDIPFGWEYCNERCQDYSIEFCYDCYRKSKCKVCDNWYRHDPWRQDEEEEEAEYNRRIKNLAEEEAEDNKEEETYAEKIIRIQKDNPKNNDESENDYNRRIKNLAEEEFQEYLDNFPKLTFEEYCRMEQHYNNNDDDNENEVTTTSHCSLCDSYVYKKGKHCNSCIAYHGKNEYTTYIEFRCYDDDGNYLYDDDENNDNKNNIWDRQNAEAEEYDNMCIRYAEEADEDDL